MHTPETITKKILEAAGFTGYSEEAVAKGAEALQAQVPIDELFCFVQKCGVNFHHFFKKSNWYASGECMEGFSGASPNEVLGDLYVIIAQLHEPCNKLYDKLGCGDGAAG